MASASFDVASEDVPRNQENGRAETNTVAVEVVMVLSAVWLVLGTLLYSLQLNTGSFPRLFVSGRG